MAINAIGSNSILFVPEKSKQTSSKFSIAPPTIQSTASDSTSTNFKSTQAITDLREKFNVKDMSNKEVGLLSLELKNRGLISPFEASNLTIVIFPPGGEYNPNARVNLLSQVQNELQFSMQFGSPEQTRSISHVLDVLRELER